MDEPEKLQIFKINDSRTKTIAQGDLFSLEEESYHVTIDEVLSRQYRFILCCLKLMRTRRNWSQEKFGFRLSKSQSYVAKYETGLSTLGVPDMMRVLHGLGSNIYRFYRAVDMASPYTRLIGSGRFHFGVHEVMPADEELFRERTKRFLRYLEDASVPTARRYIERPPVVEPLDDDPFAE